MSTNTEYKQLGIFLEHQIQRLIGIEITEDNCNNQTLLFLKSTYSEDCIKNSVNESVTTAITCFLSKNNFNQELCNQAYDILLKVESVDKLTELTLEEVNELISKLKEIRG